MGWGWDAHGAQGFLGVGGGGGESVSYCLLLRGQNRAALAGDRFCAELDAGPGELKKRLSERCREGGDWWVGEGSTGGVGGWGVVSYCLILQGQDLAHMLASGRSCAKLGPGELGAGWGGGGGGRGKTKQKG